MKFTDRLKGIFTRQSPALEVVESPVKPDLSPAHIQKVNAQIRKFAEFRDQMFRIFDDTNRLTRAYDAGATTPFNADMRGTYTSANAEIISSDYTVRARARTIAKDTPQGKAVVRTFQNNVVGDTPFKLDMRMGDWTKADGKRKFVEREELNAALEAAWEDFGTPENFTVKGDMSRMEAFRIMEAGVVRDGFILARHHRDFPFTAHGYAVEILECDRLQTQFMGKSPDGNPIRFSIEFDKRWNRKAAYWLLTRHPGDATGFSQMADVDTGGRTDQNFRVRFDAKDIIAFHNLRDRAEQDVGFTEMDASVQSLWRLFQYEKALTYAAIASCMKPFWIKKNLPTGMNFAATAEEMAALLDKMQGGDTAGSASAADPNNPAQRNQGLKQRMSTETPGATLELDYGLELMQTDPKFPIEASHEFRQDNQRDIAVATGTSYQDISGDFQNLGFAAALMCQTPKQDYCKIRQRNFIDCVVRPIFREWLAKQITTGNIEQKYGVELKMTELDQYVAAAKFKGKRWAFVNPLVQAQTLIIMLEAGIMAPQQVQDQLPDGVSIETLYTMIAEAKSEQEKHGLNFEDSDVTRPDVEKGVPGETKPTPQEGSEQTPAKTKTGNPVRKKRKKTADTTLALIEQQGDGQ